MQATMETIEYEVADPWGICVSDVYPDKGFIVHGRIGECTPWRTTDRQLAEDVAECSGSDGFPFMSVNIVTDEKVKA